MTSNLPVELSECVEAALDKKAEELVVLDLRGLSDVTDFFIITHGSSDRQVMAIAESIEQRLKATLGRKAAHIEGLRTAEWVLMDYIDFVVHVFLEEKREFFRIERLWGDAPTLDLESIRSPGAGTEPPRTSSPGM